MHSLTVKLTVSCAFPWPSAPECAERGVLSAGVRWLAEISERAQGSLRDVHSNPGMLPGYGGAEAKHVVLQGALLASCYFSESFQGEALRSPWLGLQIVVDCA